MKYFGGKVRVSKELSNYLNSVIKENQSFVDLFCGSCNVVSKVKAKDKYANDNHKHLIAMWKALQEGWQPPTVVTEEEYQYVKKNVDEKPYLSSFIGFGCSYAGKWFGGYARSGDRNYAKNACNSIAKKTIGLEGVQFSCGSSDDFDIPTNSLVYCDIPYKNTTGYSTGVFDHNAFYVWCKGKTEEGHTVLVSEYKHNVPDDALIVWEKESKKDIRNKDGVREETIEVLFTYPKR